MVFIGLIDFKSTARTSIFKDYFCFSGVASILSILPIKAYKIEFGWNVYYKKVGYISTTEEFNYHSALAYLNCIGQSNFKFSIMLSSSLDE